MSNKKKKIAFGVGAGSVKCAAALGLLTGLREVFGERTFFPDFDRPIRLFDTDQIPYVIEQGEKAIREQLPYVKRLMES
jgi:hypothetical protein